MRVRIRRRSVSSFVSPGPRVPMPPPSRDSAAPAPTSRGSRIFQLRQLDLQLAFARPRAPREDVENELRAIDDLAADRFLDLPQLRRRQLVVEDHDVDVGLGARRGERRDLAAPRNVDGSGLGRSCSTRSTTSAPAASASPASSSSERSASSRRARPAISPTSAARARAALPRDRAHACTSSHRNRARRARGAARPGHVDDRRRAAAGRSGRRRDSRSIRVAERRSTSSGSAVGGSPLMFALVAVSGPPNRAADRARDVVRRHADADAAGSAGHVRRQRRGARDRAASAARARTARRSRAARATAAPMAAAICSRPRR